MRTLTIPLLLPLLPLLILLSLPAGRHAAAQVAPPPAGVDAALGAVRTDDSRTLLELEKLRIARERRDTPAERQDARTAGAGGKRCERLRLRAKRAEDALARAQGGDRAKAQRRLRRTRDTLAVECPA